MMKRGEGKEREERHRSRDWGIWADKEIDRQRPGMDG